MSWPFNRDLSRLSVGRLSHGLHTTCGNANARDRRFCWQVCPDYFMFSSIQVKCFFTRIKEPTLFLSVHIK
jgi:hypothetical protein